VQIGIDVEKILSTTVEKAYEALYDVKTPTDGSSSPDSIRRHCLEGC